MKSIVVIPTYNERDNILRLLDAIHVVLPHLHVLVVDDNSPDGTSELVTQRMEHDARIFILKRPGKNGLGTAYCDGFCWAIDKQYEVIAQMDADFSHSPEHLQQMLTEIETYDVVVGSRYISGVNVVNWPMSRLLLSYFANVYTHVITGLPIKDATGGFKVFRAEVLKKIDLSKIQSNGYAFQIEMNFRVWRLGARIKEMSIIFVDRMNGTSKMSKNIIYEAAWLVWRLKFETLVGKQ